MLQKDQDKGVNGLTSYTQYINLDNFDFISNTDTLHIIITQKDKAIYNIAFTLKPEIRFFEPNNKGEMLE
jgi:hypothetical protein